MLKCQIAAVFGAFFSCLQAVAQTQLPFSMEKNGISLSTPSLSFSLKESDELIVGNKPFILKNSLTLEVDCKKAFCLTAKFNSESTWILKNPELLLLSETGKSLKFSFDRTGDTYTLQSQMPKTGFVRVCLSQSELGEAVLLCTSFIDLKTGQIKTAQSQISVNKKKTDLSGSVNLQWSEAFEFSARTALGSLKLKTVIPKPSLYQAFELENGDIQVTFYGASSAAIVSTNEDRGAFWQHTIGDLRNYQTDILPKSEPFIQFQSDLGLLFSAQVLFTKLPSENDIIRTKSSHSLSTYKKEVDLQIALAEGYSAQTEEADFNDTTKTWRAAAPNKYSLNSPTLKVTRADGKSEYFITPEIYRAFSTYVSARAGLSVSSGGSFATLGDLSLWHWFEKPFGLSPVFSYQRWGASATLFQSATSSSANAGYQVSTLNGIYRLTPGTTERIETLGLTVGGSSFKLGTEPTINLVGLGMIWSRSLPNWFNAIFGWTEFLRRPKWTDFEVMHFPVSLDSNVTGSITQVRATARIEMTKASYFDAGWGVFLSSYQNRAVRREGQVLISRGYFGLGYRF